MNQPSTCGVMRMYKERRAVAVHGEENVQEWILSASESRSDAVKRSDEARVESNVLHREWEALLVESAPMVFRVARGVLRNDADAEDVAQEALLRAYRRFGRLRERTRFRAWLVRIAFRLALDRLRSTKRRQQREAQWLYETARVASAGEGRGEFQRQLESALDELPEKQRLVLLLAAMEGHTLEEVSVLLDVPVGTVKSRLFFAKKALAEKLRCFVNAIEKR
jgi:RNA polymerase sigma-70 factor (ECF subfamily)